MVTKVEELLYPYTFKSLSIPKPWSGKAFRTFYPDLPESYFPAGSGESIEVGGHEKNGALIANGPARGLSLNHILQNVGPQKLLGYETQSSSFPLMIKFLDTAKSLSLQVHPEDSYERGQLLERGKSEAWLVLQANQGACIYQGVKPEVSEKDFWTGVQSGCFEDFLNIQSIQAGTFLYNPAGMVHAIGGGMLLLEIQQNCEHTYRIADPLHNQSQKRELHLQEARKSLKPKLAIPEQFQVYTDTNKKYGQLLHHRYPFTLKSHSLNKSTSRYFFLPRLRIYTCLKGKVTFTCVAPFQTKAHKITIKAPESLVFPAIFPRLEVMAQEASWLIETIPVPEK